MMKKKSKTALIGAGLAVTAVAAAVGISRAITKNLIGEALDREEPRVVRRARGRLMGTGVAEQIDALSELGRQLENRPTETVEIKSFDGTRLVGHFYPAENPKRILIAMHGWRSNWWRDFGAIADFWHDNGCSVLYAEQRGQGESDGEYMGFGLIERYDCLEWTRWVDKNRRDGLPIYLAGLSMGATTVLMTAGLELPESVRGIIADCGFTSPKAIWQHVTEKNLRLSYGLRKRQVDDLCRKRIEMDADAYSTGDAMLENKTPVLFIHGMDDHFVPVSMTYENYALCKAPKEILIVKGADHGMSYIVDREAYETAVKEFWAKYDG